MYNDMHYNQTYSRWTTRYSIAHILQASYNMKLHPSNDKVITFAFQTLLQYTQNV